LASLCFPSFPRFCGQTFYEATDKDLALHCVAAYNDWMIDEWCASAPGRYIPMVILPLWDPTLAVTEIERCAAKGARAVAFSENPEPLGLPTIFDPGNYWEPVMAAAADNELVVCMHAGSSSQVPKLSADSPPLANLSWGAMRASGAMLSWLFSGYFQRMPEFKIALSEGGVGWIPYFLERAEQVIDKQRHWASRGEATSNYGEELKVLDNHLDGLDVRQLFRDHVYGCFIEDVHGAASIHEIGVDNVMVETDYPHTDSTWPDCFATAKEQLAGYTPEEQYKVLRGNAERLFRFTPAAV
jgi:predicted TIM-barrel fold metal-dependent hydrolase